jgi:protein tyrosine phosphatase
MKLYKDKQPYYRDKKPYKEITYDDIISEITKPHDFRMHLVQTEEQFNFIYKFFDNKDEVFFDNKKDEVSSGMITFLFNKHVKALKQVEPITEASKNIDEITYRNRYSNILPYNHNRVKLNKDGTHKNDYINASHMQKINIDNKEIKIILAQGPTEHTVQDFLQMCVEQKVRLIIMLTGLQENGIAKCADYMVSAGDECSLSSKPITKEALYTNYTLNNNNNGKYSSTCTEVSKEEIPLPLPLHEGEITKEDMASPSRSMYGTC